MPTALEIRFQPGFYNLDCQGFAKHPPANHQYIGIIMFSAHDRREKVIAEDQALATSASPDDLKLILRGITGDTTAGSGTKVEKNEPAEGEESQIEEVPQEEEKKDGEDGGERKIGGLKITRI